MNISFFSVLTIFFPLPFSTPNYITPLYLSFCLLFTLSFLLLLHTPISPPVATWIREFYSMMSSRAGKAPAVRSYRRRKSVLDLDLNLPAGESREQEGAGESREQEGAGENREQGGAGENREQEGPSIQLEPQEVQANQQQPVAQPTMIDVEAIDDDVVESSPRAFAEAKNNSRRNRRRTIVDVDLEEQTRVTNTNNTKRRRQAPNHTLHNFDVLINLEGSSSSMKQSIQKPPEPPKEPVFSCPICMGPLAEEMSTRCGHIFCKTCIKAAISAQGKCPTCRKKVTMRELIRVFLPSTS